MCVFFFHSVFPGNQYPRQNRAGTLCSDDDSDGEADRRMAALFHGNQVISPEDDVDLLVVRHKATHTRAKSLPPAMVVEIFRDDESPPPPLPPRMLESDEDGEKVEGEGGGGGEGGEGGGEVVDDIKLNVESSLDRSPSHMRKLLKGSSTDTVSAASLYVCTSPDPVIS